MALVGDDIEAFWASIVEYLRGAVLRGRRRVCSAVARCPALSGSRGHGSTTPSTCSAARTDDGLAIQHASELAAAVLVDVGRAARADGRDRGGAARTRAWARATASPRTCRTSPRPWRRVLACASIGAVWSSAAPEFGARSVIDRFAQIEPKVLLAIDGYRYGGRDFDRSADGRARSPARSRRWSGWCRLGYLDGSGWEDGFLGSGSELGVRPGAVRPPAVGALQLRHDRAAQADRPQPGRDPARAGQEGAPAPRRPGRRPRCSGSRRPAG